MLAAGRAKPRHAAVGGGGEVRAAAHAPLLGEPERGESEALPDAPPARLQRGDALGRHCAQLLGESRQLGARQPQRERVEVEHVLPRSEDAVLRGGRVASQGTSSWAVPPATPPTCTTTGMQPSSSGDSMWPHPLPGNTPQNVAFAISSR